MENPEQQIISKLKSSNNVLVTVSRNPSVDQLAALIGLSLLLNKQGKHCVAVFSGQVPSTLEFLKPEETIEATTDSLRDFIIALDKNKADKLRYKVEDNIVRIFITPYRTSITEEDLDFSQGDFNVDVIVALGVKEQEDLDQAITAHGRILHDATIACINTVETSAIGSIIWSEPIASSLCELVTDLANLMDPQLLDEQISTALLTGVVAETDRFSNEKTTPKTMSASAILMQGGANQQLIASKLEEPVEVQKNLKEVAEVVEEDKTQKPNDGVLEISHEEDTKEKTEEPPVLPEVKTDTETDPQPVQSSEPQKDNKTEQVNDSKSSLSSGSRLMTSPPILGGQLTANSEIDDEIEESYNPLNLPTSDKPKMLSRKSNIEPPAIVPLPDNTQNNLDENVSIKPEEPVSSTGFMLPDKPEAPAVDQPATLPPPPASQPVAIPPAPQMTPPPPTWTPNPDNTQPEDEAITYASPQLTIEEDGTIKQEGDNTPPDMSKKDADLAREEVDRALSSASGTGPLPPIESLNAQPLGEELHKSDNNNLPDNTPPAPPVPPPIPFDFSKPL